MEVHAFLQVVFQEGAWKMNLAAGGATRFIYQAKQDHASVDIVRPEQDEPLRLRATKGTKIAISGNSIHLPDGLR